MSHNLTTWVQDITTVEERSTGISNIIVLYYMYICIQWGVDFSYSGMVVLKEECWKWNSLESRELQK